MFDVLHRAFIGRGSREFSRAIAEFGRTTWWEASSGYSYEKGSLVFRRQNGPKRRHGRRSEVTGTRGAPARSRVSYANVTASLALFVALGGTAAAAMTLPRDSVGSTQIRTNAVRASEIAKDAVQSRGIAKDAVGSSEIEDNDIRLADISAGARSSLQGAQGPAGPRGTPGQTGPQGPAGPTAAAVGDAFDPPAGPDETMFRGETSLITPSAGDVLAFGQLIVGVDCPAAGGFSCRFEAGLYLDGNPVPNSGASILVENGATDSHTLDLFGLAQDVPAGTHEITVGWKGTSPNVAEVVTQDRERSAALFVGG